MKVISFPYCLSLRISPQWTIVHDLSLCNPYHSFCFVVEVVAEEVEVVEEVLLKIV